MDCCFIYNIVQLLLLLSKVDNMLSVWDIQPKTVAGYSFLIFPNIVCSNFFNDFETVSIEAMSGCSREGVSVVHVPIRSLRMIWWICNIRLKYEDCLSTICGGWWNIESKSLTFVLSMKY